MGQPAARVTDMTACPMVTPGTPPVPHVGGPIIPPCAVTVLTGGLPQARVTDMSTCVGPPAMIVTGAWTVLVVNQPAARMGDTTSHGGSIITGLPTVLIGTTAPAPNPGINNNFHTQQQGNSCVVATTRNIIERETGVNIPEATLRAEFRSVMNSPNHNFATQGINPIHAQQVLANHGVTSTVHRNQSINDLARRTQGGNPVMVGFRNPGHRVAVSGVETDAAGNQTVVVMDPAGTYGGRPRRMPAAAFNNRYNPNAIVIDPD